MFKKLTHYLLLFLLATTPINTQALPPKLKTTLEILKDLSLVYPKVYVFSFLTTYIHEVGHTISAKALLNAYDIRITVPVKSPLQDPLSFGRSGGLTDFSTPEPLAEQFKNNKWLRLRAACMCLMGPLAGLTSIYCVLKASTVFNDLLANNNDTIRNITLNAIKKPLINPQQDFSLVIWGAFLATCQLDQLLRLDLPDSDGTGALEALDIENPGKKHPDFFKSVCNILGYVPPVASLYALYKLSKK